MRLTFYCAQNKWGMRLQKIILNMIEDFSFVEKEEEVLT
jgi:hypothetical protein